jgi:hypothetical protein
MSKVNYQTGWTEVTPTQAQPIHDASWLDTSATSHEELNHCAFVEELSYDQEPTEQVSYLWNIVTGQATSIHKPY